MKRRAEPEKRRAGESSPGTRASKVFLVSLAGGGLIWASFPPVGLSWLAWLAPVPWLWLVIQAQLAPRSYGYLWLAGAIHWLALLEGITRAHVANYAGWLALGFYLGAYLPLFVAMTRSAVHRLGVSLIGAAPVVWLSLELVRGYLLTGFSMGLLGHALAEWTWLIQVADVGGAVGVSFVVVFTAAGLVQAWTATTRRGRYAPLLASAALLVLAAGYGAFRLHNSSSPSHPEQERLQVALLQGTRDKVFAHDPERDAQSFRQYWDLMRQAREENPDLDLIIWPEASFSSLPGPELLAHGELMTPPEIDLSPSEFEKRVAAAQQSFGEYLRRAAETAGKTWRNGGFEKDEVFLILGAETIELQGDAKQIFNSALLIDPAGRIVNRYYKTHPVMFGEYIPFGRWLPWIYSLTPMSQGLTPGEGPRDFPVKGYHLAPSICFESTVPHLMRRQFNQLAGRSDQTPDVLVNVTDDGWFWGSTILDFQLACAVFRAVELRRPFLVAANTGISAWIDGNGRIIERGPKRREHIVMASVARDGRQSLYRFWGDLPACGCLALTLWWALRTVAAQQRLGPLRLARRRARVSEPPPPAKLARVP